MVIGVVECSGNGGVTRHFQFKIILRKKETFVKLFVKYVVLHSTIFTESHRSCVALTKFGWPHHRVVNHSQAEFKNNRTGATTNATGGTWSGIRRLMRQQDVRILTSDVLFLYCSECASGVNLGLVLVRIVSLALYSEHATTKHRLDWLPDTLRSRVYTELVIKEKSEHNATMRTDINGSNWFLPRFGRRSSTENY